MLAMGEIISGEAGSEALFPACSKAAAMPAPATDAR